MPIPLRNPYDASGKSWKSLHKVSGQVSHEDYLFFKSLFPADGSINAAVSTLFKNLIDELKEINDHSKLECAWYVDSPTYTTILKLLQRRTSDVGHGNKSTDTTVKVTRGVKNKRTSTKE